MPRHGTPDDETGTSKTEEEINLQKQRRWDKKTLISQKKIRMAIADGMNSGLATDFNPQEHLKSLKEKRANG